MIKIYEYICAMALSKLVDFDNVAEMLSLYLKNDKFQVYTASNGNEALSRYKEKYCNPN